jgi:hypothetical protein
MALYSDGSLMLYFLILLSLIGRYEFMNSIGRQISQKVQEPGDYKGIISNHYTN